MSEVAQQFQFSDLDVENPQNETEVTVSLSTGSPVTRESIATPIIIPMQPTPLGGVRARDSVSGTAPRKSPPIKIPCKIPTVVNISEDVLYAGDFWDAPVRRMTRPGNVSLQIPQTPQKVSSLYALSPAPHYSQPPPSIPSPLAPLQLTNRGHGSNLTRRGGHSGFGPVRQMSAPSVQQVNEGGYGLVEVLEPAYAMVTCEAFTEEHRSVLKTFQHVSMRDKMAKSVGGITFTVEKSFSRSPEAFEWQAAFDGVVFKGQPVVVKLSSSSSVEAYHQVGLKRKTTVVLSQLSRGL